MKTLAILAACSAWLCIDCNAHAYPVACEPYRAQIADVADEVGVPVLLLTALVFSESTCNPLAVNASSGASGMGQILPGTFADGNRKRAELFSVDVNLTLTAEHLRRSHRLCKSWRGAVGVYHGNEKCRAKSKYADGVIRMWKRLERETEIRS